MGGSSYQGEPNKASVKITFRKPERMLPPPKRN
jgi:hypothetical protein